MQLAALDHRVVEHVEHGLAQRLGPVEADQHRAGHVQTPLTQVYQQVGDQRRVLRRALHQRQRMLVARRCRCPGRRHSRIGEVHAVDHQRDEIQPGQIRDEQLGQGGFGYRDEPARDRRLTCRRRCFGDLLADWFEPDRVAAGRSPASILSIAILPRMSVEAEQLIRGDRQFARPIVGPRPTGAHGQRQQALLHLSRRFRSSPH